MKKEKKKGNYRKEKKKKNDKKQKNDNDADLKYFAQGKCASNLYQNFAFFFSCDLFI